ncbi:MAG: gephyrin-like molybdotransferase Glp [Actinomycetota bacterium]
MQAHVHDHDSGEGLVPVQEYHDRVLSRIEPLAPIDLHLQEALGCVAAHDVHASEDMPSFSSSAMDGFAVRSADVAGASADVPVELAIVGRARIGRRPDATVGGGEAVRIDTGAPIPAGADCVVPIESCVSSQSTVRVLQGAPHGKHVRPAGEDARSGDLLVPAGRKLGAPELGILASAGCARAPVHPRPRVVILSTGDELIEPGQLPHFGQVRDSNGYALYGATKDAGARPYPAGIVRDDVDGFRETILSQLGQADAFISSGGVSVGERDVVKRAFFKRGEVEFTRVAMQPGMPQAFGEIEGKPYFGLPGNPVSVFVSFELFVRPALLKMAGRRDLERPTVDALLETEISGPRGKTAYARVRVRRTSMGWLASSTGSRSSNLFSTVSRANGLAVLPPGVERLEIGERCRVIVFRALED